MVDCGITPTTKVSGSEPFPGITLEKAVAAVVVDVTVD
jgi:hypothetical protein